MGIVVQKFGGRLLESPSRIRRAAEYIINTKLCGDNPVVVVSAPGRATDHLIRWAGKVSDHPEGRELDMLLSVGERMAMALLALAINADGRFRSVSFTGSQVGIITDTRHTDASIVEVKGFRIREAISLGQIPIIAGFQGISTEKEITTLGRGGSDATAVALAAALGADRCELIKEAGGIYSADPLTVPDAQLLPMIDYGTLETMTQAGAKVVQSRAAALAREHNVVLSINAPDGRRGTLVVDRSLTRSLISSMTLRRGYLLSAGAGLSPAENAAGSSESYSWSSIGTSMVSFEETTNGMPVDLLTVVGWGGRIPAEAVRTCISALRDTTLSILSIFRSAESLQVALPESNGTEALNAVHASALTAGLIERYES